MGKYLNVLFAPRAPWSFVEGKRVHRKPLVSSGPASCLESQVQIMKRVHVIPTCAILVLALVSVSTAAQQPRSVSQRSYDGARRILDKGIQALGGVEKFRLVEDISIKYDTKAFELGQSANPEAPLEVRREEGIRVIDLREKRSYRELKTKYRGGTLNWRKQVLNDKSGFTIDLIANVAYPIAAAALPGNARGVQRWLPHLLIQTALARAGTLRLLGNEGHEGRAQHVISFADVAGSQIALYFDAQSDLLTKYEVLGDDPLLGDVLTEIFFSDYRDVNGLKVPFKSIAKYGGTILWDQTFIEVKINTRPADELFAVTKGAIQGPETYGALSPTLTKLAPDVYFLNGISAGDVWFYSQMFVVFKDYVLVVESPLNDGISQAIITKIKEVAPDKPIKYLVPTHYHSDHLGGVRAYIAEGATILTTPGNRNLIETIAATPHTIRPDSLSLNQRKVAIEIFTDRKIITDGQQTVELYNLGPTPHVDEIVIVYLPKEKILFVSDLMMTRITGPFPPVSATDLDFAKKLRQLNLRVETVANGHGWIGKINDFLSTTLYPVR